MAVQLIDMLNTERGKERRMTDADARRSPDRPHHNEDEGRDEPGERPRESGDGAGERARGEIVCGGARLHREGLFHHPAGGTRHAGL